MSTPSNSSYGTMPPDVLVVDDVVENLKLMSQLLIGHGYKVRAATDGETALEAVAQRKPELILLDIKMPGIDGFEVCKRLHDDKSTSDIPIIFVTASVDPESAVKGLELGAVDYITKPFREGEVLARVKTHTELYRMRRNLSALVDEKTHALALDEERFEALYELSKIGESEEQDPVAFALESAVAMTRSEVGYLHFISEDQQHIDLYMWSHRTMEQCTAEPTEHYPLEDAGIWADCIRQGEAVIHNDYPEMEGKHGLPEGHFPVQRHMSVPINDKGKVVAIIGVGNKQDSYNELDARQLDLFGSGVWSIIRQRRGEEEVRSALHQTIEAIANTVEMRDPYTAGHQRRVAELACAIAREMGLDRATIEGLRMGGVIHDIGKINIASEILNRPGKLTDYELNIIKTHPEAGYHIIKNVKCPWPISDIIYQHHERMNGSGYPQGLKGEEICLEARILAVADVVEAMASHRPYRPGLGIDAALEEITRERGVKYDADAVDSCMRLFTEKGYSFPKN